MASLVGPRWGARYEQNETSQRGENTTNQAENELVLLPFPRKKTLSAGQREPWK